MTMASCIHWSSNDVRVSKFHLQRTRKGESGWQDSNRYPEIPTPHPNHNKPFKKGTAKFRGSNSCGNNCGSDKGAVLAKGLRPCTIGLSYQSLPIHFILSFVALTSVSKTFFVLLPSVSPSRPLSGRRPSATGSPHRAGR